MADLEQAFITNCADLCHVNNH